MIDKKRKRYKTFIVELKEFGFFQIPQEVLEEMGTEPVNVYRMLRNCVSKLSSPQGTNINICVKRSGEIEPDTLLLVEDGSSTPVKNVILIYDRENRYIMVGTKKHVNVWLSNHKEQIES